MKIAIISTFLGQKTSGAEISSFLLTENLNKKEEVFVVTSKVNERMQFKCYSMPLLKYVPNLVLLFSSRLIDYYMTKRILKIFRKEKLDIVHIQDYSMMISALKAAKKMNIPAVFTVRSYQFICNLSTCLEQNKIRFNCDKNQYKKCLYNSFKEVYGIGFLSYLVFRWFYNQNNRLKKWFKEIDYHIAVSDFIKNQVIKSGIDKDMIKTIKVQKEDWIPMDNSKKNEIQIFSAGGLKKSKGFDYLIKSFRLVVDKYPKARLRIAGDGSAEKKLRELVKKLELSNNIYFLGKISHDKIQEEYINANFIISPSLWPEPLTRIIFETFSMKKTIIATNVGGSSELVKHNETGLLVKVRDVKEMADAIIRLIKNPNLRNKMGVNGYNLISKECNDLVVYKNHMNVYKKLLK